MRWARETAGLGAAEAAHKIGLNAAYGLDPVDRLHQLETGEKQPSEAQLAKMASQYRRPLLTFYLPEPPRKDEVGEDFRTLPEKSEPGNTNLQVLLRQVRARQRLARELLEDEEDSEQFAHLGAASSKDSVRGLATKIVKAINFDLEQFRGQRTIEDAFAYLRTRTEDAGVYVLLAGDLGSWQTAISVDVFRGFALTDDLAPFVVINDQDAKSAWAFTLLHELCHLWLGQSAISGSSNEIAIEKFCNDVASEILIPADELTAFVSKTPSEVLTSELITSFAAARNISRSMVAYRLHLEDGISYAEWIELKDQFHAEWLAMKSRLKADSRRRDGGPNWYIVRRHRIGDGLLQIVRRAMSEGSLTPSRAARVLGVKPMNVYPLVFGDPGAKVA
ncbi:XRE family transcriptional regulator [Sphingomicrobium clamense]|uniref:XRE family transcriptional regulator n=1 Tax=Sphingomicrobium clamense TaxID=2851013 RepID=A0ABS6V851_9SPHN|nr:XRE family transcriptional regulator [Sphingomicrobium sp. B8]MBW0145770.1 XRE family transcriptional regulator [Sphingomicrobium sp. B8]